MTYSQINPQQISLALLEHARISIIDSLGTITWVNDNFCQHCGYSREELVGKKHTMLSSGNHADALFQSVLQTITQGAVWQGEIQNIKKNGDSYWDEIRIAPCLNIPGQPTQYIGLHNDISCRKQQLEALTKRAHRQGLLAILGRSASYNRQLQPLLDQIISALAASFDMDLGVILQHHRPGSMLLRAACGNRTGDIGHTELPLKADDLAVLVHSSDAPILIEQLDADKRFTCNDFLKSQQTSSGIALTLGNRSSPWGMLALFSDKKSALDSDDIFFIHTVCNLLTESIFLYDAENKLKKEKELSQKYLDMANVMFIAINKDENIILANKKAALILEHEDEPLTGKNWFENFIEASCRDDLRRDFEQLISGKAETSKLDPPQTSTVITRHGNTRLIRWHNTIVSDDQNQFICTLSAGEDITEQVRAEKEKERILQELQQARKLEAIGHMVGGIAHDFNNILASIIGYTELALEKPAIKNDKKLLDYLLEVEKSGHRAKDIVSQLSIFSKNTPQQLQPAYLPTLLKSTLKMLGSAIPTSLKIDQSINMDTPTVMMDAIQFNQLITQLLLFARNILNNNGGLNFELETCIADNITCNHCHQLIQGECVRLSLRFSGPAFDTTPLIVWQNPENFSRQPAELIDIKNIVHELSGHTTLHTEKDNCAQLDLFFQVNPSQSASADNSKSSKAGARIMIVDDDNSVAGYLGELLTQCQFKPDVFTDSSKALKNFDANPQHYDLILTDQVMPMVSGLTLAKHMLTIRPDLPIIIMTGYSDQIDENIAAQNHISGFMRKPLQTQTLLEKIDLLLSRH